MMGFFHSLAARVIVAVATAGLALALAAPAAGNSQRAESGAPIYYLALGDSVAAIENGYPEQLAATLEQDAPTLRLVNRSCPGESTSSMISGYPRPPLIPGTAHFGPACFTYPHRSQLGEATSFLRDHRGFVGLVTIDLGANDVGECLSDLDFSDAACLARHQSEMTSNLAAILADLRAAAGPDVPIVGMNYYDPFSGLWVLADELLGGDQDAARRLAMASADFAVRVNDALEQTYADAGDPWADVETAFAVTDFTNTAELPGFGTVPLSVFNACTLTLFCSLVDVHPNEQGSAAIAQAFERVVKQGGFPGGTGS
jgi:lysophospholipase L1-like esterase